MAWFRAPKPIETKIYPIQALQKPADPAFKNMKDLLIDAERYNNEQEFEISREILGILQKEISKHLNKNRAPL